MSASSKKKLAKELNAAKLTERQLAEQKEAKQLKIYTGIFTAVLAVIVVVAVIFASIQFVITSGIREKNTVAVTLGGEKLSNAQLNYFYIDSVNQFAQNYGSYAAMFGLDVTKPLNEQVINEETGKTWADDFLESAKSDAQSIYALVGEAKANNYTLSEDEISQIDNEVNTLGIYATVYGYANADDYIQAIYGHGASMDSYREYMELRALANSYYAHYAESLTYDEAALRAGEEGKEAEYNAYSYNYYYLNANKFLQGGTTAEDGTTTYSDEEKAAAVKAAEEAAKALTAAEITSIEELNAAIAALEINAEAETPASSTECRDYAYSNVTSAAREWITASNRTAGDLDYVENATTTTAEDGTEEKTINGYYVVYFVEANDNNYPLANVRHILIKPEGGTYDSSTGATTYTQEELTAAMNEANQLLEQWKSGKASEEAFIAMAQQHSTDPGSKDNGGLYEDVYPGQMVANFNDWCFDESRKPGDTGLVESDYGVHIMYYVSDSETMYRDFLIENTLRNEDVSAWYQALVEATEVVEENTKYLSKDLVLSPSSDDHEGHDHEGHDHE